VRHLVAVLVAVGLAAVSLGAQSDGWKVPRTPDGKPDLSGVWANNHATPMTRPTQWKDKASLTDAEVEELKQIVARYMSQGGDAVFQSIVQMALDAKEKGKWDQKSYDPTTGNYNQFWLVDRDLDNRTSLIIDPPDGQLPTLTPDGEKRRANRRRDPGVVVEGSESGPRGRADGPEDRPLSERCLSFGAPRTGAGYNSYVQIVQSPESVVLLQEMIHDARVIDLAKKAHLPASVRLLHGDSRGWWDGDTFVVETTNYVNGFQGSTPDVKLTERYTRVSQDFINWEITIDDAKTWVQPWTMMIRLKRTDEQLYEYACHEGNYSMAGMLAGARRDEAKAAEAAKAAAKKKAGTR
jgi:hypothetical protein